MPSERYRAGDLIHEPPEAEVAFTRREAKDPSLLVPQTRITAFRTPVRSTCVEDDQAGRHFL